ncbi:MAG: 30S ribosomal protein S13 [Candidatus Bipolaricaulia bacterium]
MPRIAGVDLPQNKRVEIGLTYIYGIGRSRVKGILEKAGVDPDTRVHELTEQEVTSLRREIENHYTVEGDLRRQQLADIQRLKEINCYRGIRHKQGLPVRGQRTRSNARSWKGRRQAKAGKRQRR